MLDRLRIYLYVSLCLKRVQNNILGFPRIFMKLLSTYQFLILPAHQACFCYLVLLYFDNGIITLCNNFRWNRTRIQYNESCILHSLKMHLPTGLLFLKAPIPFWYRPFPTVLNFAAWLFNMSWQQMTHYYNFVFKCVWKEVDGGRRGIFIFTPYSPIQILHSNLVGIHIHVICYICYIWNNKIYIWPHRIDLYLF